MIHPLAVVSKGAQIASDVEVGPYSIIGEHVKLDSGCWVGPHVVIEGHTSVGARTKIFQFASVGSPPQDLKFDGEPSTLEIGKGNVIREYVTLQPGTKHGRMRTRVGDNNLFMVNSHVAHDCEVGSSNVFANSAALAGHVQVGNRVVLGGLVGVHQFVRIGDAVMLSGGAMVTQDVPPFCMAQGDRARLRGLNLIALKRGGFTPEQVGLIKRCYQLLKANGPSKLPGLVANDERLSSDERVQMFVNFIAADSQRGITSASKVVSED